MTHTASEPRIETASTLKIAGLRKHHAFGKTMSDDLTAQWHQFGPMIPRVPNATGSTGYGLCFDAPDKSGFEYLTGIEVTKLDDVHAPLASVTVPAKTYAVFPHQGHVSKLSETVQKAWDWLPTSGRQHDYASGREPTFFERYGEKFDPQTGFGDIEIWVPVKG